MPTIAYPNSTGSIFDYTSIELDIGGRKYIGHSEISYSDDLEPGEVYGSLPHSLGVTRGQYKAEGSFSMLKAEAMQMIADMGDGWMEQLIKFSVQFSETGQAVVTDDLYDCRIKKADDSYSAGSDAAMMKFDLRIGYIKRNGISPTTKSRY
jgi:hypothetical protein